MKTTIDRAGRVVIPRGLRAQVGLVEGGEVDIVVHGSAILLEPLTGHALQKEGPFLVIPSGGQPLDDDALRELRLGDQG